MPQANRATLAPRRYRTRVTPSGATVLVATGRLNYSAAADLRHHLHSVIERGGIRVVVDLADVQSVDSSGIGALISALKKAQAAGGDLRITAPNAQVVKVLEQTRLTHVLVTCPDADTAFDGAA